jgi:hypothetical protein
VNRKDVLAIDPARATGITRGNGFGPPKITKWLLPKMGGDAALGETLYDFRCRLINELADSRVSDVVVETPLLNIKAPNLVTLRLLYGMTAMVETVCFEMDVPCWEMSAGTWKKAFCGTGRISKKMRPYPPMVRCEELGWKVSSTDEADSAGIWASFVASRYGMGSDYLPGGLLEGLRS